MTIQSIYSIFSNESEKFTTQELHIKAEATYYTKEAISDKNYDDAITI